MNIKHERPPIKKSRLENEVILAVVALYFLLSAAMLAIHHLQPGDVETKTSSTSPAHGDKSAAGNSEASNAPATDTTPVPAR
jgi:hypothetical protein